MLISRRSSSRSATFSKMRCAKPALNWGFRNIWYSSAVPGSGLGIRIIGEITAEKVKMVQDADAIWREEIAAALGQEGESVFRRAHQHEIRRRYGRRENL